MQADTSEQTPRRNKPWLFQPGQSGNPAGSKPGISFRRLLIEVSQQIAAGDKSWRDLLIDKAFRRAIKDGSDPVIIHLMRQLDETMLAAEISGLVRVVHEVSGVDDSAIFGDAEPGKIADESTP